MKPNWSCPICGMSSATRFSVQRHIHNLHNAHNTPIRFVDYLVGRQAHIYPPGQRPSFRSKKKPTLSEKIEEEAENIFAKRIAEAALPPPGDKSYKEAANVFKPILLKKMATHLMSSNH